jgi:CBS domain-containing protein
MQIAELMHRDVMTIEESEDLSTALQLMRWNGVRHLPVVRDERVVGMLSERDVLAHARADEGWKVQGSVGEAMSQPVKIAPPHMDPNEAAGILVAERIDALPVVDAGTLVGIVTSTDVLGHVAQCEVMPAPESEPTVDTLMIRKVHAAFDDDPLADAAARMAQYGIRHLPVVDGMMRVRGILSERDVREATGRKLVDVSQSEGAAYVQRLKVGDVMTPDPRTVLEGEPLSNAVRALVEDRFGALPVVDESDRLRGILSYVDLLRYLGARLAEDASGREAREARA